MMDSVCESTLINAVKQEEALYVQTSDNVLTRRVYKWQWQWCV